MNNPHTFEGRVALVTGASSGIGLATALALGRGGASVAVNYFSNESGAWSCVEEIIKAGGQAVAIQAISGLKAAPPR